MKKVLDKFTGVLSHPYSVVIGVTALGLVAETVLAVVVIGLG
jgi:hypothetical protein